MSQPHSEPRRLGNLLIERGYLTPETLASALENQHGNKSKLLGEILIETEACTEEQVVECLAIEYGVPLRQAGCRGCTIPRSIDVLPRDYVEKNLVLPLFVIRDTLTIALAEPSNLFLIDEIADLTKLEVQVVVATSKDIRRILTNLPNSKVFVIDDIIEDSDDADVTLNRRGDRRHRRPGRDRRPVAGHPPGQLHHLSTPSRKAPATSTSSRPNAACECATASTGGCTSRWRRRSTCCGGGHQPHQDHGRAGHRRAPPAAGRPHPRACWTAGKIDLRVSTLPMSRGEKTVIRVLDTRTVSLVLEDLGFAEDILAHVRRSNPRAERHRPGHRPDRQRQDHDALRGAERHQLDGEQHLHGRGPGRVQLAADQPVPGPRKHRADVLPALRTLLRQDPDVIMVGEIRDEETARIAIQAALTGHLVLQHPAHQRRLLRASRGWSTWASSRT